MMNNKKEAGQNLIEVMLALALFLVLIGGSAILAFRYLNTFQTARNLTQVRSIVGESFEAVQNIVYKNWSSLQDGNYGLSPSGNQWQLQSQPDTVDSKYIRTVAVSSVLRDTNCQIVAQGGTSDPDTKLITVQLNWPHEGSTKSKSFQQYFTSWNSPTNCLAAQGTGDGDTGGSGPSGNWQNPITQGSIDVGAGNSATDVDVMNKIVYISTESSSKAKPDIFSYDVSIPTSATLLDSLDVSAYSLQSIDYSGNYLYGAATGVIPDLKVVNASDPGNLSLASEYNVITFVNAKSIFKKGGVVYLGVEKTALNGELFALDASDPIHPSQRDVLEINGNVNKIFIKNDVAYLATSSDSKELVLVDVSDPNNLQELGSLNISGSNDALSVFVASSERVYLGVGNILYIVNASDPTHPLILGSLDVGGNVNDIYVSGNLAFLATSNSNREFQVVNISTPASPSLWSYLNFSQIATGVDYENNLVYVSVRSNDGLRIVTSGP